MRKIIRLFTTIKKMDISIKLTENQTKIFDTLVAYRDELHLKTVLRVAGGWVRDKIMGLESHDIDIALDDMKGEQFVLLLKKHSENKEIKISGFGVTKLNPDLSKHLETATAKIFNQSIDFVNLRSETYSDNSRIPTIEDGTPEADALRRDFTIVSLFYNLMTKQVEDLTGKGVDDLKNQILRTPLPPLQTFRDDPLRVLRCFRFKSRFGFTIDNQILKALESSSIHQALKTKVSKERVGIELWGILKSKYPEAALSEILRYNFWNIIFQIPKQSDLRDEGYIAKIPSKSYTTFLQGMKSLKANIWHSKQKLVSSQKEEQVNKKMVQYQQQELSILVRLSWLTIPYIGYHSASKKPMVDLVQHIVKNQLKYSSKVARFATKFGEAFLALQKILKRFQGLEKQQAKIAIIKWLRLAEQKWQLVLHAWHSHLTVQQSKQLKCYPLQVRDYIVSNHLEDAYLVESFINGTFLGQKGKKGKVIKTILDNTIVWRVLHISETQEAFLELFEKNQQFFQDQNSYQTK